MRSADGPESFGGTWRDSAPRTGIARTDHPISSYQDENDGGLCLTSGLFRLATASKLHLPPGLLVSKCAARHIAACAILRSSPVRAGKGVPSMSDSGKPSRVKSRLGRGLSSLISVSELPAEAGQTGDSAPIMRELPAPPPDAQPGIRIIELPLASIVPNPHQPRRQFDEASLAELANSLKTTGMIQPVIVRSGATDEQGGTTYQLIAGERRWRA